MIVGLPDLVGNVLELLQELPVEEAQLLTCALVDQDFRRLVPALHHFLPDLAVMIAWLIGWVRVVTSAPLSPGAVRALIVP